MKQMSILERIRREKGFTQTELAAQCGITQGMISEYEKAKTIPELRTARRIAKTLGVSIETLWPEDELKSDSAA